MQVTELANDGLKRAYSVTVSAGDIASTRDKRLAEIAKSASMPGFRPGKVPMSVVRQRYGAAVLGEVLEQSVNDATRQVVNDRGLKPALQPKIEVTNFAEGADLEFKVEMEILPDVPMPDFSGIALERLKAEPSDEEIEAALNTIAQRNGELTDAEPRPAAKGEILVCDFVGTLPADILPNGPALGARVGDLSGAPTDWQILPGAVEATITEVGTEGGLPFFDLTMKATTTGPVTFSVFPGNPKSVRATPGETLTLALAARITKGALPANAAARLGFNLRSEDAFLSVARAPAALDGQDRASLPMTDNQDLAYARPVLDITIPPGAEVDLTLRIGPARVYSGAEEPEAFAFGGGTATDLPIEVGGSGFIPGFTEQIEGLAPGETRDIDVVFPADYGTADLAGKRARFAITAKALKQRAAVAVDDALASKVGLADLAALKGEIRSSLQREYDALARLRLKRGLLDSLAEQASFEVPEGMVDSEFEQIWQRVEADLKAGRLDDEDKGKDEETLKSEYRGIAARRIRLGLLLSEIGRVNNIQVGQEEMARAVRQEAMRYPGQEQQVLEFFRKNPQATENLRAPLFEEKVVDFVLELAKVTDRNVAPGELSASAA